MPLNREVTTRALLTEAFNHVPKIGCSTAKSSGAKPVAEKIFTDLLGDVAIGITRVGGNYGLKVNLVSAPAPAPAVNLPAVVKGVPVSVEVTGPIKKRKSPAALRQ